MKMKVQCPSCKSKYNIDISKIPEIPHKGIRTTCPKCKSQIPIKINKEPAPSAEKDLLLPCPQCGHINISTSKCVSCGHIFSDEDKEKNAIAINKEA